MRQAKPLTEKAVEVLWPKRQLPPLVPRPNLGLSVSSLASQWEHAFNYVPGPADPDTLVSMGDLAH